MIVRCILLINHFVIPISVSERQNNNYEAQAKARQIDFIKALTRIALTVSNNGIESSSESTHICLEISLFSRLIEPFVTVQYGRIPDKSRNDRNIIKDFFVIDCKDHYEFRKLPLVLPAGSVEEKIHVSRLKRKRRRKKIIKKQEKLYQYLVSRCYYGYQISLVDWI